MRPKRSLKEIEDRIAKRTATSTPTSINVRLSNTNRPKFSSPLAQLTLPVDGTSDIESVVGFDVGDNEEGNINDSELLSALFLAEGELKNQKTSKQ